MIWNSVLLMTVIDVLIIFATSYLSAIFYKHYQANKRIGVTKGVNLIISGLIVIALFYLLDLLVMHVLTVFTTQAQAMNVMMNLHLNWSWVAALISVGAISIGLGYLVKTLIPKTLSTLEELALARDQLKQELATRQQVEIALRESYENLEQRVSERTAELEAANAQLAQEIIERQQIVTTLRESQNRLQAILDNTSTLIHVKDKNGRYMMVNRRFLEATNLVEEVIIGKHDAELYPKALADQIAADDECVLVEKQSLQVEYTIPHGNQLRTYITAKVPLCDDQGRVYAICGVSTDITERKQAEAIIQRKEQRWRSLLENIQLVVVGLDVEGYVEYVNPFYLQLTHFKKEEVLGKNWFSDFLPKTVQVEVYTIFKKVIEKQEYPYHQNPILTKEGDERMIAWSNVQMHDVAGNVTGTLSIGVNVTEQRQAEKQIRARNRELALLNRISAVSAASLETKPILKTVCQELAQAFDVPIAIAFLLNETKTEAIRVTEYMAKGQASALKDVIPVANVPLIQQLLTRKTPEVVTNAQNDVRLEFRRQMLPQRGIESVLLVPLIIAKEVEGLLGLLSTEPRDFTMEEINLAQSVANQVAGALARIRRDEETAHLEAQLRQAQKMEAIGLLAGGIAHDFNNLLTSINGYSELLQRRLPAHDPLQKYADAILYSGQRATALTRQLLAFSRKQVLTPQVLNLEDVVTDMEKMLKRIIGEHIQMETAVVPDLWSVKADPAQIEQIIVNVAVNARDAMLDGGRLTIELDNVVLDQPYTTGPLKVKPGEYIMLAISDTGQGMSEEVQDHIFEPFFTTKEVGKGTGLGLATVFGIVKQNKGTIWVYSEKGIGTTFKIYLPRTTEDMPLQSSLRDEAELPSGDETILIVEDDAGVRELLEQVLQERGYTLLMAQNGSEALERFQDHAGSVHMLLTDMVMPGMGGKALAQQLTQQQPGLATLYMSGYTNKIITHHRELEPGVDYLQKPFGPLALARKVREVLDERARF